MATAYTMMLLCLDGTQENYNQEEVQKTVVDINKQVKEQIELIKKRREEKIKCK